jgi:integrase
MARQRFTDSYLIALNPAANPYKQRDNADVKGFGIQVSTGGAKTFFLAYTIAGKAVYMNLGRYTPPIRQSDTTKAIRSNLVERREYARKLRSLAEQGIDPRQWETEQKGLKAKGSLGDLLESYLLSLGSRPSAVHAAQIFSRDIRSAIDDSQPANTVTPDMVTTALAKIVKRGALTQANRAHSYLHAAFRYGLQFDNDPSANNNTVRFYLSINPVSAVKRPRQDEPTGDIDLSAEEIKQLWTLLDGYEHMTVDSKAAIKLLIITGQRVESILAAPRSEFDCERGIWDIPANRMKAKRSHVVPLHPMAIEIIQQQMAIHDSPMLFPGGKEQEQIHD